MDQVGKVNSVFICIFDQFATWGHFCHSGHFCTFSRALLATHPDVENVLNNDQPDYFIQRHGSASLILVRAEIWTNPIQKQREYNVP